MKAYIIGTVSPPGNREGYPQWSPPGSTMWSTDGTASVSTYTCFNPAEV